MRKEIEVKARVENFDILTKKLSDLGCIFSEPEFQEDTLFVNFTGSYTEFRSGKNANFLRIRKTKGKTLFTLKQPQVNELDVIEREVEISDAGEMKELLDLMGYHEAVKVNKTRTKTNYNGWDICLDQIEGLGSYVEVEKIAEETDGEAVQKELFAFLETLGIKLEDREIHGYDTLMYIKQNNK